MSHFFAHLVTFGKILLLAKLTSAALGSALSYRYDPDVPTPRTTRGFFAYCFPPGIWSNPNVRMDVAFNFINWFMKIWILVPAGLILAGLTPPLNHGLTVAFGPQAAHSSWLPMQAGIIVLCVLTRDFFEFYSHMLAHRWQFLWEFHAVHHSSEFLNPFGENRAHVVDDLWRVCVSTAGVSVLVAFCSYLGGVEPDQVVMFGLPAVVAAYAIGHALNFDILHHSHIPFRYYPFIERFLMSPAQHQLHHNREGPSKNYGTFLAVWDGWFGSFSHSIPKKSYELGIPEPRAEQDADDPGVDVAAVL